MSKNEQLSIQFDEFKSIVVCVERPDGTTFYQEVQLKQNETPEQAKQRYQNDIGNPYGWYTENGQHKKYIKKNAYLVCGWRWK